jgi:uncharacterized protein HemX
MAITGIGLATVALGTGIYQAQQQQKQIKKSNERAAAADQAALTAAQNQQKVAAQEFARANQKQPDVAQLLDTAAVLGTRGAGSTMLTGPGGVDPLQLQLGRTSLLGA